MRTRIKGNFSKLGLLCLALVLGMGSLGIGYAAWSDTLTIHGTVSTGSWQGRLRAFLAGGENCHVTVEPGYDWWPAPGIEEHSFTVTMVPPDCDEDNGEDNGENNDGSSLTVVYLIRNKGTVPIRLDWVDITTPDSIKVMGWGQLPGHLGWEAIGGMTGSMDITEDAKQAVIDQIDIIDGIGPSLAAGRILEPGHWGLIHIRLYIIPGAPENTPLTVVVSPAFNPWNY